MKAFYIAVATLSACATVAHAQSPVTVYGTANSDGMVERVCTGCFPVKSYSLARPYSFEYVTLTDVGEAFDGTIHGDYTDLPVRKGKHLKSSVQYYSRDSDSMSAAARYGFNDVGGSVSGNRAWGISVGFERAGVMVRVAHQNRAVAKVSPATALGSTLAAKNTILAANMQIGGAKAYAAYSASRGWGSSPLWNPDNPYGAVLTSTPSTDSRDRLVGIALPFGPTTLLASYIRKNDRDLADLDVDQLAFGATYTVSRRTDFYAAYSVIKNRGIAGYAIGNAGVPGSKSSAINIGMRHAF
jgi:predicted porin